MDLLIRDFICKKNKNDFNYYSNNKDDLVVWRCRKKPKHFYKCSFNERVYRLQFKDEEGCPKCIYYCEEIVHIFLKSLDPINWIRDVSLNWSSKYLSLIHI